MPCASPTRSPAPSISAASSASVNRRASCAIPRAGVARASGPGAVPAGRPAGQHGPRLGVLPGERALQDRRDDVSGEHADRAAGPQHAGDRRERGGRRVHVLKHVVADHQVRAGRRRHWHRPHGHADQGGQVGGLALDLGERDAGLARPPSRGGERVRARVHHGDAVPAGGDAHREPAGPRAHVNDVKGGTARLRGPRRDDIGQDVPDQRRPRSVALALGVRATHPRHGSRGNLCGHS